jgi:hypothetical protein
MGGNNLLLRISSLKRVGLNMTGSILGMFQTYIKNMSTDYFNRSIRINSVKNQPPLPK